MNVKRLQTMQQIIEFLHDALKAKAENCFVLHGRLSKRQRATVISELESLDDAAPRIKYAKRAHISERKFPQTKQPLKDIERQKRLFVVSSGLSI